MPLQTTIKESRLKTITDVHQLIPNLSPDCKIISFQLMLIKKGDPLKMFEDVKIATPACAAVIKTVSSSPAGSIIMIFVKRTDCKALAEKHYMLTVTDAK